MGSKQLKSHAFFNSMFSFWAWGALNQIILFCVDTDLSTGVCAESNDTEHQPLGHDGLNNCEIENDDEEDEEEEEELDAYESPAVVISLELIALKLSVLSGFWQFTPLNYQVCHFTLKHLLTFAWKEWSRDPPRCSSAPQPKSQAHLRLLSYITFKKGTLILGGLHLFFCGGNLN